MRAPPLSMHDGDFVTVVLPIYPGRAPVHCVVALAMVTSVQPESFTCVVYEYRTDANLMSLPVPTTGNLRHKDENIFWLRGDHTVDSLEVQALLAAAGLAK